MARIGFLLAIVTSIAFGAWFVFQESETAGLSVGVVLIGLPVLLALFGVAKMSGSEITKDGKVAGWVAVALALAGTAYIAGFFLSWWMIAVGWMLSFVPLMIGLVLAPVAAGTRICPRCGAQFMGSACTNAMCTGKGNDKLQYVSASGLEFRSAKGWGRVLRILLILSAGLSIPMGVTIIALTKAQLNARTYIRIPDSLRRSAAQTANLLYFESLALMVLSLITGLVVLTWIYLSYRNLPLLQAGRTRFGPGLAVLCCLIPVINPIFIYMILLELWNHSVPSHHPKLKGAGRRIKAWPIHLWFLLLIFGLTLCGVLVWMNVAWKSTLTTKTVETVMMTQIAIFSISSLQQLLIAFATWRIDRNQIQRSKMSEVGRVVA